MQRLLLYLFICLNIVFSNRLNAQIEPSYTRFDLPNFIPEHSDFYASIIFKIDEVTNEDIVISFNKPNEINIESASINTLLGNFELKVFQEQDNINKLSININSNKFGIDANIPYQILLLCNTNTTGKILKNAFRNADDEIIDNANSYENLPAINEDELLIYNIQKTAGNCLLLDQYSEFEIGVKTDEWQNLLSEFWVNFNGVNNQFITIVNTAVKDTILNLSQSELQFLSIPIDVNETLRRDVFVGKNNWNYISILLEKDYSGNYCSLYVNNNLVFSKQIDKALDFATLKLGFKNNSDSGVLLLDKLKIWDWRNNISLSQKNKHFLDLEADSSSLIFSSNFDNTDLSEFSLENEQISIKSTKINTTKSFAPIFSKAPKLNVNIGNSYNSLVWYVQEFSVASEFSVERAIDKNPFEEIYHTLADEDPLKIYYYTDEVINSSEVAYYRVKQINKDGSVVYSPEIKIGNKDFTEFNLLQNYPNPFNPITSIYLEVIIPTEFKVKVYDLVGNTIAILHDGYLSEGQHKFDFDGSNLPSGIYFYEALSPKSQSVKKMILAK